MGAPADFFEQIPDFELWPENKEAFEVFLMCSTQWRLIPMGGMQGLDYPAVESVLNLLGAENKPQLFKDIRFIEMGALGELKNGK